MLNLINTYVTTQKDKFLPAYHTHFETVFKNTEKLPIMLPEHKNWLNQNYVHPIDLAKKGFISLLAGFEESSLNHFKDLYQPNQTIEHWLGIQANKWLKRTSFYKDYFDGFVLSLSQWLDQQKILKFENKKGNKKLEAVDDMFETFSYLSQKTD